MTTSRTNRRADDFDRALAAEGGPRVDPTMAALVAVAGALAAIPQQPTPAFRDALRTKLMSEAAAIAAAPAAAVPAAAAPAAAATLRSLPKLLAKPAMQVATGGLAATIAAAGMGVGASRSLPGDNLYGLKRAVEGLRLGGGEGVTGEADAVLEQVQNRLDEVLALIDRGDLAEVEQVLADLGVDVRAVTDTLLDAARDGSRDAYDRLRAAVTDLKAQLVALLPQVPGEARDTISQLLAGLNVTGARLAAMPVPGAPGVPVPSGVPTGPTGPNVGPPSPTAVPTQVPTEVPTTVPGVPTPTKPGVPTVTPPTVPPVTVPPVTPPTVPPVTIPPVPSLSVTLPPL